MRIPVYGSFLLFDVFSLFVFFFQSYTRTHAHKKKGINVRCLWGRKREGRCEKHEPEQVPFLTCKKKN
jgi:hypothetical protein